MEFGVDVVDFVVLREAVREIDGVGCAEGHDLRLSAGGTSAVLDR